jgi:L-ribulose-5-phosphate 4-epimerase
MSMSTLRERVLEAHRELVRTGLVSLSFGNASGVDREAGVMVIKPSGVPCDGLEPDDLVAVGLEDGRPLAARLKPSSDTPTHLELYRRFPSIGGVVHTHSPFATAFAQAAWPIPCLGTTHADHFQGAIPISRPLTDAQIAGDYERETGIAIAETLEELGLDPLAMPVVLVLSHGPFSWGTDVAAALTNAVAVEVVAALAHRTLALDKDVSAIPDQLRDRHFERKHGPAAYYGQNTAPD